MSELNNNNILSNYPDVLIPKDLEEILHISKNNVYALIKDGKIKSMRVTKRKIIIPKKCLIEYLEQCS